MKSIDIANILPIWAFDLAYTPATFLKTQASISVFSLVTALENTLGHKIPAKSKYSLAFCYFSRAAIKNTVDGGWCLDNRNLFSLHSGGWNSEIRVLAWWVLMRALFLAHRWSPSHHVLTGQRKQALGCLFL